MKYGTIGIENSPRRKATLGSYLVGVYLFSVPTFSYAIDLELNYIPQCLGIMVGLYAVLDVIRSRKVNIPAEIRLYGFFVFWLVITTLLVGNGNNYEALLTSVKVGLIVLCVTQLIKNDRDFKNILFIYGTSILFVAYLNYETLLYLRSAIRITEMDRFDGTLANANTAAIYAITVLWVSFTLIFNKKTGNIIKLLCIAFASIALFMTYFSGSLKGMIGIALFAISAVWTFYKKYERSLGKRVLIGIAGFGFVVATLYLIYKSPFFFRLERIILFTDTGSPGERLYLFTTAIDVWFKNFISIFVGIGHDNFRDYNNLCTYSHSTISEVLVSAGVIGFALYFGAFILLLKKLYIQSKISFSKIQSTQIFSCFFFLLILLFFNATAVLYSSRELWPLIGIIASYSHFLRKERIIIIKEMEAVSSTT